MSIGSVIYLSFSSNECIKMHPTAKLEIVADWKLPKISRWRAGAGLGSNLHLCFPPFKGTESGVIPHDQRPTKAHFTAVL